MTNVSPGQSIQTVINGAPNGETIIIADGTYPGSVTPKNGQSIIANTTGKVIIQGRVNCLGTLGVTLRGFHVQSVAPGITEGAVMPGNDCKCADLFIHDNETIGLGLRSVKNVLMERVKIYHNGTLGCNSGQATTICENINWIDVEVYDNNYGMANPSWKGVAGKTTFQNGLWYRLPGDEGGGVKITKTNNMKITRGRFYANRGPGLWFDVDGNNVVVEGAEAFANKFVVPGQSWEAPGFAAEISKIISLLNCYSHDNTGSAIAVWESQDINITGCHLVGNLEWRNIRNRAYICRNIKATMNRFYAASGQVCSIAEAGNVLDPTYQQTNNVRTDPNSYNIALPANWDSGGVTPVPPDPQPQPPQGEYATKAEFDALAARVHTIEGWQGKMKVANQ